MMSSNGMFILSSQMQPKKVGEIRPNVIQEDHRGYGHLRFNDLNRKLKNCKWIA